jgi:hypothetical protein
MVCRPVVFLHLAVVCRLEVALNLDAAHRPLVLLVVGLILPQNPLQ